MYTKCKDDSDTQQQIKNFKKLSLLIKSLNILLTNKIPQEYIDDEELCWISKRIQEIFGLPFTISLQNLNQVMTQL